MILQVAIDNIGYVVYIIIYALANLRLRVSHAQPWHSCTGSSHASEQTYLQNVTFDIVDLFLLARSIAWSVPLVLVPIIPGSQNIVKVSDPSVVVDPGLDCVGARFLVRRVGTNDTRANTTIVVGDKRVSE